MATMPHTDHTPAADPPVSPPTDPPPPADPARSRWYLTPEQRAGVIADAKQLIETERRWRESGCRQP